MKNTLRYTVLTILRRILKIRIASEKRPYIHYSVVYKQWWDPLGAALHVLLQVRERRSLGRRGTRRFLGRGGARERRGLQPGR